MRVIIAGGGTGGHIFPALAIADELKLTDKNNEILFIGTKRGMEKDLVSMNGYEIKFIRSYPLLGKGILTRLKGAFFTFFGVVDSLKIIHFFRPEIVVGVGGYVSGPVVLASFLRRIPRVICEQNSIPGFTNRALSYIANRIFISFEDTNNCFPSDKLIYSGNPIRKKQLGRDYVKEKDKDNKFCIAILGGSQGAKTLNQIIPDAIKSIENKKICVVHQTGKKDYIKVLDIYKEFGIEAEVFEFIEDMESIYTKADLIISRSGAGTIAEVCAYGKPSILIPFPYATHNHQYYNAKFVESHGAARLIKDEDASSDRLAKEIESLLDREQLGDMGNKAREIAKPDASSVVVKNLYEILEKDLCMAV